MGVADPKPASDTSFMVSPPGKAADRPEVLPYGRLIADPTRVCSDWVYRAASMLPGPTFLWALGVAAAIPATTFALKDLGAPIDHIRSTTELAAGYFATPLVLVYFLATPIVFAAGLRCFDRLRPSMVTNREATAVLREKLRVPSPRFQTILFSIAAILALSTQQISSQRFTRFFAGDWNAFDIWLIVVAPLAQILFMWLLVMVMYHAVVLARVIKESVRPRVFDERLGAPIASFGIRSGLAFAIPYSVSNLINAVIYDIDWFVILPGLIGIVSSFAFTAVPGASLRRQIRQAKEAELDRVDARISGVDSSEAGEDELRELAALLELRREVHAMSEWPYDLKMFRGFVVYFLLPPLAWAASGTVEVLIDRLID